MKLPKKRSKKRIYAMTGGILGAGIVLAAGILAWGIYNRQKENADLAASSDSMDSENKSSTQTVTYQGKEYRYNEHLSNFLFLGIDREGKAETETGKADAGQADSIFLASWDRVKGDVAWITIPRDTMTEIQIFDQEGNPAGTSLQHLNLAYAFGDGDRESCQLMEDAVSHLFYGLPINGSCALNLDGIPVLAEAADGVTVTIPDDSLEAVNPRWKKGTEVTLDKETTEVFLRYRDTEQSQSALKRMEHQKIFLMALGEKMQKTYKSNPGIAGELYAAMKSYMVTNIGNDQLLKLMEGLGENGITEDWTLPGEGKEGTDFDEYYPDDEALYEKIIETFYIEESRK